MQRLFLIVSLGLLIGTCYVSPATAADSLAMISSLKGEVAVRPADATATQTAKLMQPLFSGDTVWTRRDGQATILYNGSRGIIVLKPDSELVIEQEKAPESGMGRLLKSIENLFHTPTKEEISAAVAATRGASGELRIVFAPPMNTKITEQQPTLQWSPVAQTPGYEVTLRLGEQDWTFATTQPTLDLKARNFKLEVGKIYTVEVKATTLDGKTVTKAGSLRVVSPTELPNIKAIHEQLAGTGGESVDDSTFQIILAREYENRGFHAEALKIYQDLLQKSPDDEYLKQWAQLVSSSISGK